jgi:hypothetical protein
MNFAFRRITFVRVIGVTLTMLMLVSWLSDYMPHVWTLMDIATSENIIKAEAEVPQIIRKSPLLVLNIYL